MTGADSDTPMFDGKSAWYHTATPDMSAPPASARAIAAGRRALPWLIGGAALMLRGRPLELAEASRCPSVLEFASIAAVTLSPALTLGALFPAMHALVIVTAIAAFLFVARRAGATTPAAIAAGIAIAVGPLFPSTLAPPWEAGTFAACAAAALLALRLRRHSRSSIWIVALVVGSLALVSVVFVSIARPDVFGDRARSWHMLASCVRRAAAEPLGPRLLSLVSTFTAETGPFVMALAGLGFVAWSRRTGLLRSLGVVLVATAGLLLPAVVAVDARITLMPWLLVAWLLAAIGIGETIAATGLSQKRRAVAAVLLTILTPALQASRGDREERDDRILPIGHQYATLERIRALLNIVPTSAVLAREDAGIDVLLRAAIFGGRRATKPFTVAPRDELSIDAARRTASVYAFPIGQRELGDRGFRVEPLRSATRAADPPREVTGLGLVAGRRRCATIVPEWSDLREVVAGGRIALAADAEAARGPVIAYLGTASATNPRPDGWPLRVINGFRVDIFDRSTAADVDRLVADARRNGVREDEPVLAAPFVVRLVIYRTLRAPLTLPVILDGPFSAAVAKLEGNGAPGSRLQICDAPAVEISPLS